MSRLWLTVITGLLLWTHAHTGVRPSEVSLLESALDDCVFCVGPYLSDLQTGNSVLLATLWFDAWFPATSPLRVEFLTGSLGDEAGTSIAFAHGPAALVRVPVLSTLALISATLLVAMACRRRARFCAPSPIHGGLLVLSVLLSLGITGSAMADWTIQPLYSVTKKITADGSLCPGCARVMIDNQEICPDCYTSAYFAREKIGNREFAFSAPASHWITHQILSMSNTRDDDPSEVTLELEYSDYECAGSGFTDSRADGQPFCPVKLLIRQIASDFGASRMGDGFSYTRNQQLFFQEIDGAPTVAELEVDGSKEQYCPRDKLTVRFKITDLPTIVNPQTGNREQAVYAISVPERQKGSLRLANLRVLSAAEGDGSTCEAVKLPSKVACDAFSSGKIQKHILQGDTIGLIAVPSGKTYGEIVGFWTQQTLPPLFTANRVDQRSVIFAFKNGTTASFPNDCQYVRAVGAPGDDWAEVRIKYRARRFDSGGSLLETRFVDKAIHRWDWTVESPKALARALLTQVPPISDRDPNHIPVSVDNVNEIQLTPGQIVNVRAETRINPTGVLRITTLVTNSQCYLNPSQTFCNRPKVVLSDRAWVFVSGKLIVGAYDILGRFRTGPYVDFVMTAGGGSAIARAAPTASIQGVTLRQADLNHDNQTNVEDARIILQAIGTKAGVADARDIDGDGKITVLDVRKFTLLCDKAKCAPD